MYIIKYNLPEVIKHSLDIDGTESLSINFPSIPCTNLLQSPNIRRIRSISEYSVQYIYDDIHHILVSYT